MDASIKKICGITTRAATARFMIPGLKYLHNQGYKAYIICEYNSGLEIDLQESGITYIPINMKSGNVGFSEVIKRTYQLVRVFRKEKFAIIQYASCNASLYSCIAGRIAKVPTRILCQWGLTYLAYAGVKRLVYKTIEKITCYFSTNIQPDSHTNLQYAVQERLYDIEKGNVIWNGSACGLDLEKFDLSSKDVWRSEIRLEFNVPNDAVVYGFVGRIVKDKGVNELLSAFNRLCEINNNIYLFLFGPHDGISEIEQGLREKSFENKHIIFTGPRNDIYRCVSAINYLVLPSYREGFGLVILEAAAMKVPTISSKINGPTDFVLDATTGFLCDVKSDISLYNAFLRSLRVSSVEYEQLCLNAYEKVVCEYEQTKFNEYLLADRNALVCKQY